MLDNVASIQPHGPHIWLRTLQYCLFNIAINDPQETDRSRSFRPPDSATIRSFAQAKSNQTTQTSMCRSVFFTVNSHDSCSSLHERSPTCRSHDPFACCAYFLSSMKKTSFLRLERCWGMVVGPRQSWVSR